MRNRFYILSILLISCFISTDAFSQIYEDYIGAGHTEGIEITSSSEFEIIGWDESAQDENTLSGSGLDGKRMAASRFLGQASLGGSEEEITYVTEIGFEAWIDEQFTLAGPDMLGLTENAFEVSLELFIAGGGDPEFYPPPAYFHFHYAWWQNNMLNEDLLRQRVTLALSEIFVISFKSDLDALGYGLASYYDILLNNAFGNFEDLLLDITLHPAMGYYLSHFNNPLSIPLLNIHPDENYAREVMQLFSIGLYELNTDGTWILDGNMNPIPTYDNTDISGFAKVFTGLGAGAVIENDYGVYDPEFGFPIYFADFSYPMIMYEEWHEPGPKPLLNGFIVPAGQTGMEDVEMTINHLFNHQNVGPFLARRLIQNMVKSNPTPAYIEAVAEAFNDNGIGVRGDMKAVIRAILLHEEARSCDWVQDDLQGKLKEPMWRYFHFCRSMDLLNPDGIYWNGGYNFMDATGQSPLNSPSVFNFFLPDFQPLGPLFDMNLFGPEFQIHNSQTSLAYFNEVFKWTNGWPLLSTFENTTPVYLDINNLSPLAKDPEVLINKLDVLLTHGLLTNEMRDLIRNACLGISPIEFGASYLDFRTYMALYLFMISPDYNIQK